MNDHTPTYEQQVAHKNVQRVVVGDDAFISNGSINRYIADRFQELSKVPTCRGVGVRVSKQKDGDPYNVFIQDDKGNYLLYIVSGNQKSGYAARIDEEDFALDRREHGFLVGDGDELSYFAVERQGDLKDFPELVAAFDTHARLQSERREQRGRVSKGIGRLFGRKQR